VLALAEMLPERGPAWAEGAADLSRSA
jgi:hypothetical protein